MARQVKAVGGRSSVPLSEDEQRILSEIERSFYEHDPAFARNVSSATLTRHASRYAKMAGFAFLAGLLLLLISFASMFWLAAVAFLVMLASAFVFVTNIRKLARSGLNEITRARGRNFTDMVNEQKRRLRGRFKREE
jgi:hypothetical protein